MSLFNLRGKTHLVDQVWLIVEPALAATNRIGRPIDDIFAHESACLLEIVLLLLFISCDLLAIELGAKIFDVSIGLCVDNTKFAVIGRAYQVSLVNIRLYREHALIDGEITAKGVIGIWSTFEYPPKSSIACFPVMTVNDVILVGIRRVGTYSSIVYIAPSPRSPE